MVREKDQWIYFCGVQPVFQHAESDRRSFQMFTAQLICQGACRQVDIVRVFGVSKNSVIRSVNKYRAGGVKAFYTPRASRGASVMTPAGHGPGTTVAWEPDGAEEKSPSTWTSSSTRSARRSSRDD